MPEDQMQERVLHVSSSYLEAISVQYNSFNALEKQIADYLLQNGAVCQHLSIREFADACGCGTASVVRFCRKLRYEGFTDLKYHIRSQQDNVPQDDITLRSGEGLTSMTEKALQYATLSLRNTVSGVDARTLDLAARSIMQAENIQLCAMGSASGVALAACSQFLSFGLPANFPIDELQQLRAAARMRPGDVLIGINYHNRAKNVADAFMAARKAGATTILITASSGGVISRYADFVFCTPQRRINNSLNISTTTLCQSMIVQLLILRIWQLDPEKFDQSSGRIRSFTRLKLYDSGVEEISLTNPKL